MFRILKNYRKHSTRLITYKSLRFLRSFVNEKHDCVQSSYCTEDKRVDDVEMAKKELLDLTGGMDLQQLREILQPNKYKKKKDPIVEYETKNSQLQCTKDKDDKSESLLPTYNISTYVSKSPTLQMLVKLGVNLDQIQRRKGLAQFVLNLRFEEDIKSHLLFLKSQGIPESIFGEFITKNPLIFKESLDDLQTRLNYLEAKKFQSDQIQRILCTNPYWLMFSTKRIDRRLGYFQQEFLLNGNDVRFLATKAPRLITYNMDHIRQSTFCVREEMGFDKDELKCLLLNKPRLWMIKSDDLIERFAYVHNDMKISHDMLLQMPEILASREFRIRERHEFLKLLGRAQYDPKKDLYISPKKLVEGNNNYFARHIAKSDIDTFALFLKTR